VPDATVPSESDQPTTPAPNWHPPQELLEVAELVLTGALPTAVQAVPVPADIEARLAADATITLEDAEGTPVATAALVGDPQERRWEFTALQPFSHGPVRAARRSPAEIRAELTPGAPVLGVPVTGPLSAAAVEDVRARAERTGHRLLWLAVTGTGRAAPLPADGLWRAVRDVAAQADPGAQGSVGAALAVPVLVPRTPSIEGSADTDLIAAVARGYGASEVLTGLPEPQPGQELHPAFAREYARAVPPPHRRGLTVFFTGLSGSGKSTVAKALAERLLDHSTRTVSLLDGDEVRRMLSAGLTFSRADRDLNIRRIGYVAAEVTRHGGLAICAPIAPFESVRAEVRAGVEAVGDFVLVHISTPLQECERRDRKGLYAKARRGEIPEFTGISSPYEVPADAQLRIDTTGIPIAEAVDQVWALLAGRGYLSAPEKSALEPGIQP